MKKEIEFTGKLFENRSLENLHTVFDGILYTERWLPIAGYEGIYQISSFGRVKALSINKLHGRYYSICKEKILKQKIASTGYPGLSLSKDKVSIDFAVHRLVAEHFIPNPENKSQVNHKEGIKTDNRFFMLEWVTPKENTYHATLSGLNKVIGEDNWNAKLTEKEVVEIRSSNLSHKQAANKYGVYFSVIQKIRYRKAWKHI